MNNANILMNMFTPVNSFVIRRCKFSYLTS